MKARVFKCMLYRRHAVVCETWASAYKLIMVEFTAHKVYRLEVSLLGLKLSTLLVLVYSHYHHTYIIPYPHITVYCTISHISTWHIACGSRGGISLLILHIS